MRGVVAREACEVGPDPQCSASIDEQHVYFHVAERVRIGGVDFVGVQPVAIPARESLRRTHPDEAGAVLCGGVDRAVRLAFVLWEIAEYGLRQLRPSPRHHPRTGCARRRNFSSRENGRRGEQRQNRCEHVSHRYAPASDIAHFCAPNVIVRKHSHVLADILLRFKTPTESSFEGFSPRAACCACSHSRSRSRYR